MRWVLAATHCTSLVGLALGVATNPPNLIIFQTEGMDIADIEPAESAIALPVPAKQRSTLEHPYIDLLKSTGVTFSRGYAASPKCAPSRFAILTGRFPSQNIANKPSNTAVPSKPANTAPLQGDDRVYNLQKELQGVGYHTGMMGKYHVLGDCAASDYAGTIDCVKADGWDSVESFATSNLVRAHIHT